VKFGRENFSPIQQGRTQVFLWLRDRIRGFRSAGVWLGHIQQLRGLYQTFGDGISLVAGSGFERYVI
jgi:hypothetical protein